MFIIVVLVVIEGIEVFIFDDVLLIKEILELIIEFVLMVKFEIELNILILFIV